MILPNIWKNNSRIPNHQPDTNWQFQLSLLLAALKIRAYTVVPPCSSFLCAILRGLGNSILETRQFSTQINTHYSCRNYFSAIFWSLNPDLASEFSSTLQGLQLSHLGYQPGTLTQHGAFGCFSAAACGGVTVSSAHHRINGDDGIYWDNFSRKIMLTIRGDISWGNHGILQRTIWGILTRYF